MENTLTDSARSISAEGRNNAKPERGLAKNKCQRLNKVQPHGDLAKRTPKGSNKGDNKVNDMGEYVNHLGQLMKVGTCENLYYATFRKFRAAWYNGLLSMDEGSLRPADYLKPNSGFRFRFPFPDEDDLALPAFHSLKDFERGLLITIERGELFQDTGFPPPNEQYTVTSRTQPGLLHMLPKENPNNVTETVSIEIVQQKFILHDDGLRLVLCYRCPYAEVTYRLDEIEQAEYIAEQVRLHYVGQAVDERSREFWNKVAERIVEGYVLPDDELL